MPVPADSPYLLLGPFTQLLPMAGLALKGPLKDADLPVVSDAGLLLQAGKIVETGPFETLEKRAQQLGAEGYRPDGDTVCLPGLIDSHTHSCFAGSRARDYALRNSGSSYLEIAEAGGGIWDTVTQTRKADPVTLERLLRERCKRFAADGVTTLEVKSGYGLSVEAELKMLRVIRSAAARVAQDLIPTCLAAHTLPRDFKGGAEAYLNLIVTELLPVIRSEGLAGRVDAFVERSAFSPAQIGPFFDAARRMGFDITVHADQFSTGGSAAAIACRALSADHLEASGPEEVAALARSSVVATALPGASLGLGCGYTPARALLDAGACLAIASDYNPGSAPMGDLLAQAAILGAAEKLSNAEVLAGITFRAAAALGLKDRGRIEAGQKADLAVFPTDHYNEILYHQGRLKPVSVWKDGRCVLDLS